MRPSFPVTSPFAYQVETPSRSHRTGEISKSSALQENRDSSVGSSKKLLRTFDEGKSSSKGSRSHSSTSSLYSQRNLTLEDIPISSPTLAPVSPTMSASRPVSTSRSAKSTTRSPSQSLVRAAAQQAAFMQQKVEDEVETATVTPTPAKTPLQKPVDAIRSNTRPSTPAMSMAPAPSSVLQSPPPKAEPLPPPPQQQQPVPTAVTPRSEEKTEIHHSLPASRRGSPIDTKTQTRNNLDEPLSKQTSVAKGPPEAPATLSTTSPPLSPRLQNYSQYNFPAGYMSNHPPSDSQRSSPVSRSLPGMPPMNYGYMPMMTSGAPPSMYGNPYYGMPFSPTESMAQNNEGPRSSSTQDEHQQLLEKVAGVLPDISRLLNSYKEAHGQLSAKELLVQKADLSHNEQLSKVKAELEATKTEYEKVIQSLVSERAKLERDLAGVRQRVTDLETIEEGNKALRTEVEGLQANNKELTEAFDAIRLSKEEMQTLRLANEKEIDGLKKALETERDLHHRNVSDVKKQAKDQMEVKQKEFHKTVSDHKLNYSKVQMEFRALLSKHNSQSKDLDMARSLEADHKIKLDLKDKECEDALARHAQQTESITKNHDDERERIAQEGEERVAKMGEEISGREKGWEHDLQEMGHDLESEKAESQRLRDELEVLRNRKEAEKLQRSAELVDSLALWRTKSNELQQENHNLDRILQSLGYATEMKSKGDDFFLAAFSQLADHIVNLSRDHFVDLPKTLPEEKTLFIPQDIPSFMDSTPAATEIRVCYIQHLISNILLVRIFQPFLFTLGRRYGGVDTFLQSLSTDIRLKSERRETVWRQTTLRAAYTVSKAKEAINVAAAVIVDEIIDEIKYFAHPSHWVAIAAGVQRIVKSAAEVWRCARVEREIITPFMPEGGSLDAPSCDWPEPTWGDFLDGRFKPIMRRPQQAILCLLPHILREPVHEGFLGEASKHANRPCTYLQGQALYADTPVVLARRKELGGSSGRGQRAQ